MAGIVKAPGAFAITPHKVSVCILLQVYASPHQFSVPYPFSEVSQHNNLSLFLLALTKSCEDILEPRLDDLINQLRVIGSSSVDWLADHLTTRLSSLSSPDDLFNFFTEMRGILAGPDSGVLEDDQIILDPNSNLGIFLRRCILAFNILAFEGVCHLLTNIGLYSREVLSSCAPYDADMDDSSHYLESTSEYENMELENFVFEKVNEEIEAKKRAGEKNSFHLHIPPQLVGLVEEFEVSDKKRFKKSDKGKETCSSSGIDESLKESDSGIFLRSNWQIQGYLSLQADAIEKHGSSFSLNAFERILQQLHKLAPELHRVHFLRYLNSLHHDDYTSALEHLHKYFDYSAGIEGFDVASSSSGGNTYGRYEIALLCLGMMEFHFGHPKQALEVLAEAVRVSQQQNNDTCLAYTSTAICNLLFDIGISSTSGLLGSSYSPVASTATSLTVQQQLFVLLRGSLKRAENMKLKRLVASNHLAMAKFHLMYVQRPLLSFGPNASVKLKTCPVDVCKEIRLSSCLITEFGSESSMTMIDGVQSTEWLKSLEKPTGSSVLFEDSSMSGNKDRASSFFAQPSSIPSSVLQMIGSSYLFRATTWELYGSAPLARINALLYATYFADYSSAADAALAYGKLIRHLALYEGYKAAFAALKIAEDRFLSISKSQILIVKLQLLHEHALHRGQLKKAKQVCDELGLLASSVTGVDMDLKTEAALRKARTLLAAKQYSQAADVAHSLFCMCYEFNLHIQNASVLLLIAEIYQRSGNSVLALPYALASLSFCQSLNLDLLKATATLTLAELWLSLGANHAKRALTLLHSAFPMILGHGGLELRARAYIAEAKCYFSDPSYSVEENPDMVLDSLRQASDELQLIEYHELAAEAFYLMAITYDKLGQLEERENAATSFKKHIMALENPENEGIGSSSGEGVYQDYSEE